MYLIKKIICLTVEVLLALQLVIVETVGNTHFCSEHVSPMSIMETFPQFKCAPTLCGSIIIRIFCYCSFSLNLHNSRTDYFPKMQLAVQERKRSKHARGKAGKLT